MMMMTILEAIGKAIGVDADDVKVLATVFVVVVVLGIMIILMAVAAGLAVSAFELARWA